MVCKEVSRLLVEVCTTLGQSGARIWLLSFLLKEKLDTCLCCV